MHLNEAVIDQLRVPMVTCLYQDLHCSALLISCIDVGNLSAYYVPCALICICLQGIRLCIMFATAFSL